MELPLVLVRWLDSISPKGWQSLREWEGAGSQECVSVGYLFSQDELALTVIPHFAFPDDDHNRQGAGIMIIPAGAVISLDRLEIASAS